MLRTVLRRDADDAFVIQTDEPDLQAILPSLAYAHEGGDEFVRRFPTHDETPAIYERFAAAAPAMLAHTARREPPPWESSLEHLHDRLEGVDWLLSGSAALAIRGVALVPRDIDLVVPDHHATTAALGDLLIEPPLETHGRWIAEWFGRVWDGTRMEWAAETRPDLDDHEWTSDIGLDAHRRAETVEWRGRTFKVAPLDLQAATARERGLLDRVAAIERLS